MSARIGLTIKSTELRPGEVMRLFTGSCLWSPATGAGWFIDERPAGNVPTGGEIAWDIGRVLGAMVGTIIAVDVPADAEALARVCRGESAVPSGGIECATDNHPPASDAGAGAVALSDATLIAALRAHPDPLGLLGRAKIAGPWRSGDFWLVRCDIATWRDVAEETEDADCAAEDARLRGDGWRLL